MLRAFTNGERLVLSDEQTRDEMQVSGRWVASKTTVEVRE